MVVIPLKRYPVFGKIEQNKYQDIGIIVAKTIKL